MLIYEIELLPAGNKIGFNLLDSEYFTIPCVIYTIPNSPDSHQLPTQANRKLWVIAINVEEPITYQGALDELNCHQTLSGESKVKISLCRRKIYQRTDLEDIYSILDQFIPVISHL